MTTAAPELRRFKFHERATGESRPHHTSLRNRFGGFVVGLIAQPSGKHTTEYITKARETASTAGEQKRTSNKGIARLVLGKLFRRGDSAPSTQESSTTENLRPQQSAQEAQQLSPAWPSKLNPVQAPRPPFNEPLSTSITEYFGTDGFTMEAEIPTTTDFVTLESWAWGLRRVANSSEAYPSTQRRLNFLLDKVHQQMATDLSPTGIYSSPHARKQRVLAERAARAEAEAAAHTTAKLQMQP